MDTISPPSAKQGSSVAFFSFLSFPQLAMDTVSPPSAKQTTMDEHREEALRKKRLLLLLLLLLTVNSGQVMYISWGDLVSVASVGVTYVALGLLLGRRFGCWEPRTDGARRWLGSVICFLLLLLAVFQLSRVLQVSRLARTAASSTSAPMLVAAAGAAALGIGGGCAYLLHRRSWSKQQRQEGIFLPLRQEPRN